MPLYEYQCPDCDHRFELLVRNATAADGTEGDSAKATCPKCGSAQASKRFSTFAAVSASPAPMPGGCAMPGCGAPFPGACGGGGGFCEM